MGHDLVMPFVLCATNGGPLDDDAFVVGWDCGVMYAELTTCQRLGATPRARWVKTAALPQLDLIAMDTQFTLTLTEDHPEAEWTHVSFAPHPHICTCPPSEP